MILGRQSTEYFSVQFRATFVTFSGRGVLLLRRASTNKVLDAMRSGNHFSVVRPQTRFSTPRCADAICAEWHSNGHLLSSAREDTEGLLDTGANEDVECDASRAGNGQADGSDGGVPAASYAPPKRGGRPMRHGWRRRHWTGLWSSRRQGRHRGHDRE